jgi:hypothetical protein
MFQNLQSYYKCNCPDTFGALRAYKRAREHAIALELISLRHHTKAYKKRYLHPFSKITKNHLGFYFYSI